MTGVAEACAALAAALPRAQALIAVPDTDGTTTASRKPGSKPPWNQAVANAVLDALEGVRRLEASLRPGGSTAAPRPYARTGAALDAIGRLAEAVTRDDADEAARLLARWETAIGQLPAIDEAEHWQRVDAECSYCRFPNALRVAVRSGRVTCIRYGACLDADGKHPTGVMEVSQLDGSPRISWSDGLVT